MKIKLIHENVFSKFLKNLMKIRFIILRCYDYIDFTSRNIGDNNLFKD